MPRLRIGSAFFAPAIAVSCALIGICCGGNSDTAAQLMRHRNLGKAHFENGDTDEAIAEFRLCVRLSGNAAAEKVNLAKAYFLAEEFEPAIETFLEAREDLPRLPDIPYSLGIIYKRLDRPEDAIEELERLVELDERSVEGLYNLGLLYAQKRRNEEASACMERVLALDPHHAPAHYQLYTLARLTDRPEQAERSLERFTELKKRIPAEKLTASALEESPYFEIGVREPGDAAPPDGGKAVTFRFVASTAGSGLDALGGPFADALLADLDGDGDPDLAATGGKDLVRINDGRGSFSASAAAFPAGAGGLGLAAVDYDNDGDLDLFVCAEGANRLLRNDGPGGGLTFSDAAVAARLAGAGGAGVTFADYDHDGDLDAFSFDRGRGVVLYRNNGSPQEGSSVNFTDVTGDAALAQRPLAVALFRDFDNDGAIDFASLDQGGALGLFRNAGQQQFEAREAPPAPAAAVALAAEDLNGDSWIDLIVASETECRVYLNRGRFGFEAGARFAAGASGANGLLAFDPDNDGDMDLLLAGAGAGASAWLRNDGTGRLADAAQQVGLDRALGSGARGVRAADVDRDGDLDLLVVRRDGALDLLTNEGGDANPSIALSARGGKSNRFAIGAAVEVQEGEFFFKRTLTESPLLMGIGPRRRLDYVKVTFPSGIIMDVVDVDLAAGSEIALQEKPEALGSCPSLYAWNGERYAFVTDVLATTSLGLPLDGGEPMAFDDEELIRVDAAQLRALGDAYRFAITEELDELVYLDRVELLVADHPPSISVYSNSILREPPFPAAELIAVTNERPLASAVDQDGMDVLAAVSETDGAYAASFDPLDDQFFGICTPTRLSLDLGGGIDPFATVLVINAWMDWPETATLLSVGQNESIELVLPMLEVLGTDGWRVVHEGFGIQALKPKDVVVDLRGRLRPGERLLRLSTNINSYWNRICVAEIADAGSVATRVIAPIGADLHFRGWAEYRRPDRSPLKIYDYHRVCLKAPWAGSSGRFTRYGDVLPLVAEWDDRFAILNTGDEVSFAFDASAVPPVPSGRRRTFFVRVAGFEKQADYGTLASGDVDPLPFRAMTTYPYGADESYPNDRSHREYEESYLTRRISRRGG